MGREGCCKQIALSCARSVSAPLGLPLLTRTNRSGSTLLRQELCEAGPRLRAHPWTKPLRFGAQVALRGADAVGTAFVPFPGPSSSGVWRARSVRLVAFPAAAAQFSGWTAGAPCEADGDCPARPEVLEKKPACSLVGRVSPGLQLPLSSPYSSDCLSPAGDGLQRLCPFHLCSVCSPGGVLCSSFSRGSYPTVWFASPS